MIHYFTDVDFQVFFFGILPFLIPALLGAAGAIGSSVIGANAQADATSAQERMAQQNIDLQREFATMGIQWKTKDAMAAGIHPLAALGAQTTSFSPISISDPGPSPWAEGVRSMGQDLSRAASAAMNEEQRMATKINLSSAQLDLEGKALDNQIRAAQLAKLNSVGPSMAGSGNFIPGQGNSGLVVDKPLERVVSQTGRPAQEAGWRPDVAYSRTDKGLFPVIPESLSESLEDDVIGKLAWRYRNQIVPMFTGEGKPARSQLPKGAVDWKFNLMDGWVPVYSPGVGGGRGKMTMSPRGRPY